jgi:hypothetical protein
MVNGDRLAAVICRHHTETKHTSYHRASGRAYRCCAKLSSWNRCARPLSAGSSSAGAVKLHRPTPAPRNFCSTSEFRSMTASRSRRVSYVRVRRRLARCINRPFIQRHRRHCSNNNGRIKLARFFVATIAFRLMGGQGTDPYEQKTQQSPGLGYKRAPHPVQL